MEHDVEDDVKLERLYALLDNPDFDDVFSQWERDRIKEWHEKLQITNYSFSQKQSLKIDEIYETAVTSGCFDE